MRLSALCINTACREMLLHTLYYILQLHPFSICFSLIATEKTHFLLIWFYISTQWHLCILFSLKKENKQTALTNSVVIQSNKRPEGIIYTLCSSPAGFWGGKMVSWLVCGEVTNKSQTCLPLGKTSLYVYVYAPHCVSQMECFCRATW